MSNNDLEEVPHTGWFDSESDLPGISSVDSTLELGVIVSSPQLTPYMFGPLESRIAVQWVQPPIRVIQWVTPHWKRQSPVKG